MALWDALVEVLPKLVHGGLALVAALASVAVAVADRPQAIVIGILISFVFALAIAVFSAVSSWSKQRSHEFPGWLMGGILGGLILGAFLSALWDTIESELFCVDPAVAFTSTSRDTDGIWVAKVLKAPDELMDFEEFADDELPDEFDYDFDEITWELRSGVGRLIQRVKEAHYVPAGRGEHTLTATVPNKCGRETQTDVIIVEPGRPEGSE